MKNAAREKFFGVGDDCLGQMDAERAFGNTLPTTDRWLSFWFALRFSMLCRQDRGWSCISAAYIPCWRVFRAAPSTSLQATAAMSLPIVREVAAGYRAVVQLSHKQRVTRLYRRSLKALESWACDRELFLNESTRIRQRFDANARLDPRGGLTARLVREGEEEAAKFIHPDPYTGAYDE